MATKVRETYGMNNHVHFPNENLLAGRQDLQIHIFCPCFDVFLGMQAHLHMVSKRSKILSKASCAEVALALARNRQGAGPLETLKLSS